MKELKIALETLKSACEKTLEALDEDFHNDSKLLWHNAQSNTIEKINADKEIIKDIEKEDLFDSYDDAKKVILAERARRKLNYIAKVLNSKWRPDYTKNDVVWAIVIDDAGEGNEIYIQKYHSRIIGMPVFKTWHNAYIAIKKLQEKEFCVLFDIPFVNYNKLNRNKHKFYVSPM